MSKKSEIQEKSRYYYSTYSSEIYLDSHDTNNKFDYIKQDNHIDKINKNYSLLSLIFNIRIIIVIISIIIFSTLFSAGESGDPKPENFKVARILTIPSIFNIKNLQIPSINNTIDRDVVFNSFLSNIRSQTLASSFSGSSEFYNNLKIRKDRKAFESLDSTMIYLNTKNPVKANKWLNSYLTFISEKTIDSFVNLAKETIEKKKDKIKLDIDVINKKTKYGNLDLVTKIDKYTNAYNKAVKEGILNTIKASDIPQKNRFGDLLYLQGSWKLGEQITNLKLILTKKIVDISAQQAELRKLDTIVVKTNDLKSFAVEKVLTDEDLNTKIDKQLVWSIVGAIIGLFFGLIISYPFKRKKIK